jgi:hypothetical protein
MPEAIASAVNAVMADVTYVQKLGENTHHNYKFVAVGDLLEKLQPSTKHGLIIAQNETAHEMIDGTVMTATYAFTLAHKSGVVWSAQLHHTGMAAARTPKGNLDDKALNKCHTAARKYFLMALFQIPSGVDPDADGDAPPAPTPRAPAPAATPPKPVDVDRENYAAMSRDLKAATTAFDLDAVLDAYQSWTDGLSADRRHHVNVMVDAAFKRVEKL